MAPAGRPKIGAPINTRIEDRLLAAVDSCATRLGITRAETIRRLIAAALAELDDDTIGRY